ncbi:hypothetical protein H2199_007183 [Coniosporium tulheliwenetii]|uniref:Uncharacterized protein n=1 Tax=Coniosporium tulheliwenetii TaxID=3383036 RepID=A0ACC2YQU4_9PEZI|nr:hypothetical protein H2199_007183 [Cladosporium sp. JES 115]
MIEKAPTNPSKLSLAWVFIRACTAPFKSPVSLPTHNPLVAALFKRMVVSPFKGKNGAPTYFKDVIVVLPDGIKAHWLGPRSKEKVIVYFHGGGYVLPAVKALLEYLYAFQQEANRDGHSVSVLMLAYTLAPEGQFPTQLKQAVELMRYLFETEKRSPSNATPPAATSPSPSYPTSSTPTPPSPPFPSPPQNSQPSSSSPLGLLHLHLPSFATNAERDAFGPDSLSRWSSAFVGSNLRDEYVEPVRAGAEWWAGASNIAEVLVDSIMEFAAKFKEGFGERCEIVVTKDAAHEEMVLEAIFGYKEKGEAARIVEGRSAPSTAIAGRATRRGTAAPDCALGVPELVVVAGPPAPVVLLPGGVTTA